jgi:hypothetical protein
MRRMEVRIQKPEFRIGMSRSASPKPLSALLPDSDFWILASHIAARPLAATKEAIGVLRIRPLSDKGHPSLSGTLCFVVE